MHSLQILMVLAEQRQKPYWVVQTSKRKGKDVHNLASHYEGAWWSKGTHTSTTALKEISGQLPAPLPPPAS
jgi:hypothetical protein